MNWKKITEIPKDGHLWLYDGRDVYMGEYLNGEFGWYTDANYLEREWTTPESGEPVTHWKYIKTPKAPK